MRGNVACAKPFRKTGYLVFLIRHVVATFQRAAKPAPDLTTDFDIGVFCGISSARFIWELAKVA